jgi:hypothetical protein
MSNHSVSTLRVVLLMSLTLSGPVFQYHRNFTLPRGRGCTKSSLGQLESFEIKPAASLPRAGRLGSLVGL